MDAIAVTPAMALAASEEAERLGVILPATAAGAVIEAALRVCSMPIGSDGVILPSPKDEPQSSPFLVLPKTAPGAAYTDFAALLADLLEALERVETLDDLAAWEEANDIAREMLSDAAPVWGKQVDAAVALKRAALGAI